jgi:hypothetical protein
MYVCWQVVKSTLPGLVRQLLLTCRLSQLHRLGLNSNFGPRLF